MLTRKGKRKGGCETILREFSETTNCCLQSDQHAGTSLHDREHKHHTLSIVPPKFARLYTAGML